MTDNKTTKTYALPSFLREFPLIFVFTLCILVRLTAYFSDRSIWLDEASLALDVMNHSFTELIFSASQFSQVAPIGFLLATKSLIFLFGPHAWVLRLLPLLASIASFFLFYKILKKISGTPAAVLALFLYAVSLSLLRYSVEFKQYSVDVFFGLLLVYEALKTLSANFSSKNILRLALIGSIAIWFSFPSIFFLAAIGFVLLLNIKKMDSISLKYSLICFAAWAVNFLISYALSLKKPEILAHYTTYWTDEFMPFVIKSKDDLLWTVTAFQKMILKPGNLTQTGLALTAYIVGMIALYKKNKNYFCLFLLPVILTMIASGFHRYPFGGRVILFYVPLLYLVIVEGIVFLLTRTGILYKILGGVLGIAIFWYPLNVTSILFHRIPLQREEIKPVLEYVLEHPRGTPAVFIYAGAKGAFYYYEHFYDFSKFTVVEGSVRVEKDTDLKAELNRLGIYKKVWLIFTHLDAPNKKKHLTTILSTLDGQGQLIDAVTAPGAWGFLYEFN